MEATEVNGCSLFEDLEPDLRSTNRAQVLWNLIDAGRVGEDVTSRAGLEAIQYMNHIPVDERTDVITKLRLKIEEARNG